MTTPAVHELLRRETPVAWMSSGFWFLGSTGGQGPKSAVIPTAQYAAAQDKSRTLGFARELVAAKIKNQRTILRRNWRGGDESRVPLLERLTLLVERASRAENAAHLLGVEGETAALYFRAFPNLFTEKVASLPAFSFENRNQRPPADPVNACLSLCYALLTRTFTSALATVGLDPWKGFYYVERPGRPSLAFDLIEPFRPILADSAVLMALNNGELSPNDFVFTAGGCKLRIKLINGYGRWLQLSVFHCRLDGGRRAEMAMAFERIINAADDHVIILDLGPADEVDFVVESLGKTSEPIERRAIVI